MKDNSCESHLCLLQTDDGGWRVTNKGWCYWYKRLVDGRHYLFWKINTMYLPRESVSCNSRAWSDAIIYCMSTAHESIQCGWSRMYSPSWVGINKQAILAGVHPLGPYWSLGRFQFPTSPILHLHAIDFFHPWGKSCMWAYLWTLPSCNYTGRWILFIKYCGTKIYWTVDKW